MGKVIEIYAKHNDLAAYTIYDENNKILVTKDGYLPSEKYLPFSTGDELTIKIDIETGKVLDWDKNKVILLLDKKSKKLDDDLDDLDDLEDEEEFDQEKYFEKYNSHREEFEKRKQEDIEYYKIKFEESKKELNKYKDKFQNVPLDDEIESVYRIPLTNDDSPIQYSMLCLMEVSKVLMENDINVKLIDNYLKVNKKDIETARNILKKIGAYKHNFNRKKDDVLSLKWKYM